MAPELGNGAVHREDTVGGDEDSSSTPAARASCELGLEIAPCRCCDSGNGTPCRGCTPSIMEAWLSSSETTASSGPENGLEKPGIGIKTGGVKDGVFHASKTG